MWRAAAPCVQAQRGRIHPPSTALRSWRSRLKRATLSGCKSKSFFLCMNETCWLSRYFINLIPHSPLPLSLCLSTHSRPGAKLQCVQEAAEAAEADQARATSLEKVRQRLLGEVEDLTIDLERVTHMSVTRRKIRSLLGTGHPYQKCTLSY